MIVVDASALVPALCDDGPDGDAHRGRLRGERLAAPEVIYLEVLSALRRKASAGGITERGAELVRRDLALLPITTARHDRLLARCWELRHNLTAYDAAYVALAEALGVVLVTADARLAQSPGLRCPVEILS